MYRTHHCNELRSSHIGGEVILAGWVQSKRDHGGVTFIDLRDREGFTQIVFRPEENAAVAEQSQNLRDEDVVQITGRVVGRLKTDTIDTTNVNLATGEIEIVAGNLTVLNKAEILPFPLDRELSNEDLRMKYRYLDLRRPRMAKNMRTRHKVTKAIRDYLDENGFLEIETPILSKSTPEGARDFLVPCRLSPGNFYALPQAPQQYKQLLMVAGMERYFQIARCFRDEDLRADRQPEFTQVDIECSFITEDEIRAMMEGLMVRAFQAGRGVTVPTPFPVISYQEAMDTYGSDKPDTRFGMNLTSLDDIFAASSFKVFRAALDNKGVLKAINAKGFAGITTGQIEKLTQMAQQHGAKGLAFIKSENGEWKSPIVKFFSEAEKAALTERLQIEEGDLVLFGAGPWETVCNVLGRIRLEVAAMTDLLKGNADLNFLWVKDFPLLAYVEEEGHWTAVHHPFTRPHKQDEAKLAVEGGDYSAIRAIAYDIVLNGFEIGGGSLRIHEGALQKQLFNAIGVTEEEQKTMFAHILEAFSFGAPPHGGIALGLDRLCMLISEEDSIREVIAFPKNNRGTDLMTSSPSGASVKQLREVYIQSTAKKNPAPEAVAAKPE